jgi:hypothetical protein
MCALILSRNALFLLERVKEMAWMYLMIAGLMEVGWAIGLKFTEGFTRLWSSLNQTT